MPGGSVYLAGSYSTHARFERLALKDPRSKIPGICVLAALVATGCGPQGSSTDNDSTTGSGGFTTTSGAKGVGDVSTGANSGDTTSAAEEDSGDSTGSTGVDGSGWPPAELVAVLEPGPPDFEARYLAVTSGYAHVTTVQPGDSPGHRWSIDTASGVVTETSPLGGGPIVATDSSVVATGRRTTMAGEEWVLASTPVDGSVVSEPLVTEDALFLIGASSGEVYFYRYPQGADAELWRRADDLAPQKVADVGEQTTSVAIYRQGAIVFQDPLTNVIRALDLRTQIVAPVITHDPPATRLAPLDDGLLFGSRQGVFRVLDGAEQADVLDVAGSTNLLASDGVTPFWSLSAGGGSESLLMLDDTGEVVAVVEDSTVFEGYGSFEALVAGPEVLYLLLGASASDGTSHAGSIWRLERP